MLQVVGNLRCRIVQVPLYMGISGNVPYVMSKVHCFNILFYLHPLKLFHSPSICLFVPPKIWFSLVVKFCFLTTSCVTLMTFDLLVYI